VIALPTGVEDHPWLTLRRVEEGSIFVPDEEPFTCEVFDTFDAATSRLHGLDACLAPIVFTVPDGRIVIMSLKQCSIGKRRSVR
jgi:hypothetical protein